MRVTVVLPVFNCAGCLGPLINELALLGSEYHFIFIDDCSTDNSVDELQRAIASGQIEKAQIMRSPRNLGSHKAVLSVSPQIETELVAVMAADGQDDAALLAELKKAIEDNQADVALTASHSSNYISSAFHVLMGFISKNNQNLPMVKGLSPAILLCHRASFEKMAEQPDRHLYYHALARANRCTVLVVTRRPRISGRSQWGLVKKIRFAARWLWHELLSQ